MDRVIDYLNIYLGDNDTVILGLSGGPDSMCLLDLLTKVKHHINIIICHVNHGIRPNNKKEEDFVSKYVSDLGLTYYVMHIDSYKNNSFSEEEAREKRYAFFRKIYNKTSAKCLMTAHHGDDLVESIIMRILRGSTLEGYAGIKKLSNWDGMEIVRPLIEVSKKNIYDYLESNNVPYQEDETNGLNSHLRNRIRHNILPLIQSEEKSYISKFLKYQTELLNGEKLIVLYIEKKYEEIVLDNIVNKKKYNNLTLEEQIKLLRMYFKRNYGDKLSLVQDKHIRLVNKFIKGNSSKLDLPGGYVLYNNSLKFYITLNKVIDKYCIKLGDRTILNNGYEIIRVNEANDNSNYEIRLNSKSLQLPLYVKAREPGMKMEVKNLNGSKKVKDILIDKKILGVQKDKVPVVVDSRGEVIWLPGVIKSKYDTHKDGNYDIIFRYVKGIDK